MSAQARLIAPRIAGIVLGAGRSLRMGAATNKLTMEVEGKPLLAWPVDALLEAGVENPLIVTGSEPTAIETALGNRACSFAHHAGWASGMGSSLAYGVGQIMNAEEEKAEADRALGLLLCLGDLPGLRADLVAKLLEAADAERLPDRIFVPTCGGRPGHPVLFGRRFWPQLAALSGEEGAKGLIASAGDDVTRVPVEGEAIFSDLDTPEDLKRWQETRA